MTSTKKEANVTDNKYCEGSIVRIKLENVLTYDSVEFQCGPNLNVIIGPNGTGKSSIVCAICLGLAGKTSWLGRAQQPSDFIKYGQKRADIELELMNPDGDNMLISREIHRDNTSKWKVNGRQATLKSVEEMVARLNIQVGNLTQFLPQEKVADFAKMSESELLENTEKAVGEPELYARHQQLKESQSNAIDLERDYNNLVTHLEQEKQKNSRIEQDVKNFEEREKIMHKIKDLEKKKAWVEYEEKRQDFIAFKEEKEVAQRKFAEARAAHAPLQSKLDEAQRQKEKISGLSSKKSAELKEVAKKAEACGKEVDDLTEKHVEIQDELSLKREQEETRKKQLKDLQKQLQQVQRDFDSTQETENVQPQIEQTHKNMRTISSQMRDILMEGDRLSTEISGLRKSLQSNQSSLQTLRSIDNQRLETLRAKHKDTYNAVLWLRENKQMFKGTIHEPIMLCVNMKDPHLAKYLENHLSFNDMRAFICDNSEDMEVFLDTVRDQQQLRVNAVCSPAHVDMHPMEPIGALGHYGFHSYLQNMFTCADSVMKFLCAQYKVHLIPVGDRHSKQMVDRIVKERPDMTCFYTEDNKYTIKQSLYGGGISSMSVRLKEASLLTVSMDADRERELQDLVNRDQAAIQERETEYHSLQQKSKDLEKNLENLRKELKQLNGKKDVKKRLQAQIEAKTAAIQDVESQAVDLEAEEAIVRKKMQDVSKKKLKSLCAYSENTRKCVQFCAEKLRLNFRNTEAERSFNQLQTEIREQSQALQQAEIEFERAKKRLQESKTVAKSYLEAAKKSTGTGPGEDLSPHYRKTFDTLPESLEEIESAIHEHQVRADVNMQTDPKVVEEYRKREQDIERLEKQIADKQQERDSHQETINEAKDLWKKPLEDLIARINKSFSYFFQCLKCVGEVDLHEPENKEDYGKYGIRIRVKFRDSESLKELSPHHQSGGERSVTTVLFMMALQELAKCPFRCVDEINQGMDPVNERKVFELVVQTVCKKSTSQYFLLTPKLLPDLEYADNMTILCVANGSRMLNHTNWKLDRFLRRRRRQNEQGVS